MLHASLNAADRATSTALAAIRVEKEQHLKVSAIWCELHDKRRALLAAVLVEPLGHVEMPALRCAVHSLVRSPLGAIFAKPLNCLKLTILARLSASFAPILVEPLHNAEVPPRSCTAHRICRASPTAVTVQPPENFKVPHTHRVVQRCQRTRTPVENGFVKLLHDVQIAATSSSIGRHNKTDWCGFLNHSHCTISRCPW